MRITSPTEGIHIAPGSFRDVMFNFGEMKHSEKCLSHACARGVLFMKKVERSFSPRTPESTVLSGLASLPTRLRANTSLRNENRTKCYSIPGRRNYSPESVRSSGTIFMSAKGILAASRRLNHPREETRFWRGRAGWESQNSDGIASPDTIAAFPSTLQSSLFLQVKPIADQNILSFTLPHCTRLMSRCDRQLW